MVEKDWIWMGHQAHLCVNCRFHLATFVNGYIVSTVGDYYSKGKKTTIGGGTNSFFETFVMEAIEAPKMECCPYGPKTYDPIELERYSSAGQAREGHMKYCKMVDKWKNDKSNLPEGGAD